MKKLLLFVAANILFTLLHAQAYWQQQVDYTIDVSLNDKEKTLDGFEKLTYTNHSPDTLYFIWFHLWPNAFKNDRTALSDQLLENGDTRFYFSTREEKGYINRLDFKVDGITAKTEDHPQHIDIIKLLLPKPLPPKGSIGITTPFHVKLPFNFSRGGFDGESFQVTQWYPKPAVYDAKGWHPMPYLNHGEFYSEFGSFDVRITVPKNYVVAATGELQNEEEKSWLKERSGFTLPETKKPAPQRRTTGSKTKTPASIQGATATQTGTKTLHFKQASVHDFAWFANKNFIVQSDTLQLAPDRMVTISAFYTPAHKEAWGAAVQLAKEALRFYSNEVGVYPYNVATVVQGPESFGGGMEYPTITVISPAATANELDAVIAHELGHNWFYGILATNEREHPWMDEGLNSFYESRYITQKYGAQAKEAEVFFQHKAANKTDQPIETSSAAFSPINYGLVAYHKTAEWLESVEQKMGTEAFRQMMRRYYEEWKFRHPQPEDFKHRLRESFGQGAEEILAQLSSQGLLPSNKLSGTSVIIPFRKGAITNYLQSPSKNIITLSPALGFNTYVKLMLGAVATNYGSPGARFNFLAIPLFSTGSKSLTGIGRAALSLRSKGAVRKTDFFLNASSFHTDDFTDDAATTYRMRFVKLVPGVRFTFREKDPRSTVTKYLQWKTFFISEQSLNVSFDSIFSPTDTVIQYNYSTPRTGRYLNQLQFSYNNSRALYPFDATLQVEQAQDFVRTTFTGHYFFNYAKGGGLSVRLFAGKFSYLNGKTLRKQFNNDRYHLNLTGPKGYEDYTYSDYFVGRNEFEGLPSQQIMIRDGAFKIRTDLLASKVGKTDDWLAAMNFVTTIPEKFNPLSVLPVKIPVRVFADIGTYAEAWNRNEDRDRFLFDAGLQFSLLNEAVNIYVPLLYSRVFRDYVKSTIAKNRLLKTISFSINLFPKKLQTLNRELEF